MHGILLAPLGAARLVERVDLHDPGGQLGALKGVDVEAKILAADPGDAGLFARGQVVVAGSPALPQHVAAEARDAPADDRAGDHRRITRSIVITRRSITMDSSPARRSSPVWVATRASWLTLFPMRRNS